MVKHTHLQATLMDSSGDLGLLPPPPPHPHELSPHNHHRHHLCPRHHHQHLHIVPNCPLHSLLLKPPSHHSPSCPLFSPFPNHLNPQPVSSSQFSAISNLPVPFPLHAMMMQEENLEEEPDEEEEPIFVLTDEWRDFFAKSEAKRREAKKQAKKHKN
ncbi:forkhead box protein B2-like [Ipomoea triloba]|uniref:forkhead box protein B2-like n=1 Tax=Ipomoea triloba TaxID=35885 RepID=UPI00125E43E1|nr:forkhead box protein B2-like [Ipomoea triloba]